MEYSQTKNEIWKDKTTDVLILILMEYSQTRTNHREFSVSSDVLILILMEYSQTPTFYATKATRT